MNFRRSATLSISLFVAAVLFLAPAARAQSLPSVNLGLTSFLDGGPPAGPGWYYQQYLHVDHLGYALTNTDGDDGGASKTHRRAGLSLNQVIYQSDYAAAARRQVGRGRDRAGRGHRRGPGDSARR
jgi:hypothetical protein